MALTYPLTVLNRLPTSVSARGVTRLPRGPSPLVAEQPGSGERSLSSLQGGPAVGPITKRSIADGFQCNTNALGRKPSSHSPCGRAGAARAGGLYPSGGGLGRRRERLPGPDQPVSRRQRSRRPELE